MSAYNRVVPAVWSQPWSDDARLFALYLMTCEHRVSEGLYRLPTAYVVEDLGWEPARIGAAFVELEADGFCKRDREAKCVLLVGALKVQSPANQNGVTSAVRKLEALPVTPLLLDLLGQADAYCERLAVAMRKHLAERLAKLEDNGCSQGFAQVEDTLLPPTSYLHSTDLSGENAERVGVADVVSVTDREDVQAVFDAWLTSRAEQHGTRPTAKLDDKRRRLIRKALKSHGLKDTLAAVVGWRHSPHHRGENRTQTVYDGLDLLLRDAEHLERFRDLERANDGSRVSLADALMEADRLAEERMGRGAVA